MNNCKLNTILACCSIFFLCNAANAIIVFDFGQMIPVPKEISSGISKLSELDTALTNLEGNLSAIGEKVQSISEFNKESSKDNGKCKNAAIAAKDRVMENMKSIAVAQRGIADILKIAQSTKNDLAEGTILQTEELINMASTENNEKIRDVIVENFENIKELGSTLSEDVNEAFNTALNTVNQNAQKSHEALMKLRNIAMLEEKLNTDEREIWRSNDLNKLEQRVSDEGINMIETAYKQYKEEYKEKFSDELNNYQKVVLAYASGNAAKEDVITAGEQFRLAVANINVTLNEEKRANYEKDVKSLQNKVENIIENIIQRVNA